MKSSIKATDAEPESEETAVDKTEPEAEAEDIVNAEEEKKAEEENLEAKSSTVVIEEAEEEPEEKVDYSLLDQLIDEFLGAPESLLPILCGYFNKIIQSFLNKHKQMTLEYLLLKRKGRVFDLLMNHMYNHSNAILLIELLQVQIKSALKLSSREKLR